MSDHEFTIPVADLDAGGREFRFSVRSAWVRGALEDVEGIAATDKDGTFEVRASKSGRDVVVQGTLDASLRVPCARCLEEFDLPIHSEISVLYVPAHHTHARAPTSKTDGKDTRATSSKSNHGKAAHAEHAEEEHEFTSEEADILPYEGEHVILDDLVRDELILEIPMIPLCSEACPGMSAGSEEQPAPPEEKGIDPRLAPLLRFRKKETKS
ncbi:MAG: DUF177 domain-containing protein [Polyangiaceae bacterium]|nr:DUF177 domain-containing protein [Polyangiaceae bacterium]